MKDVLFLICTLFACSKCPKKNAVPIELQTIPGRVECVQEQLVLRPVYQAAIPDTWKRVEIEGNLDTTHPNAAFLIEEEVRINVHTFPSSNLAARISPEAQLARWKNQFPEKAKMHWEPISAGGFFGYYFEAKTEQKATLGWAMQLDLDHYQALSFLASTEEEREHYSQISADYTIKATGPANLLEKHKKAILTFAKSFELIQEIPEKA